MEAPKKSSDNVLENYFLELVINKRIVDREIHDTIDTVDKSSLHEDYKKLIKKILFGEENLYLENWGTLGESLLDMIHTKDIRGNEVEVYGIVLGIILRVIEEVFDVNDELFNDFLLSESREDIEHRLIMVIKRVLDFIERGLGEMFQNIQKLDGPIVNGHIRKEFDVIHKSLLQYSGLILEAEGNYIRELKIQVDTLVIQMEEKKKNIKRISR